jgi:hypothetical protein
MKNRAVAQALVQHSCVKALDVLAGEGLQWDTAQGRDNMTPHVIAVTLFSPGPKINSDMGVHIVVQVLCHGLVVLGNVPRIAQSGNESSGGVVPESLAYQASSTARAVSRVLVAHDGVLGQLRTISVRLAKSFDWTEDQATAFILTGVTPELTRSRIHIDQVWGHGWMSRIYMEIDPTMSPREVIELYRKARSELGQSHHRFGGTPFFVSSCANVSSRAFASSCIRSKI